MKIFAFFLGAFFLAGLLYSGIYMYLRNDDWIDHDANWKLVNYSTGYVYDGHEVELKRQYRECFKFDSIESLTLPGRWIEKRYWEILNPKGSYFPKEWKLPAADKDWNKVLNIGRSRSVTAYSDLQKISKLNKDLPSGKLAATMLKLWDPLLRTYISSEPAIVIQEQNIVSEAIGHYWIKIVVKGDGTVKNITLTHPSPPFDLQREVMMHELYCPAKDGSNYIEGELSYIRMVCGI